MTLIPRHRIRSAAVAILLAMALGAVGGNLLGRVRIRHMAEDRMAENANKLEGLLDSFMQESNSLLDRLNASQDQPCSAAELAWMRQLVYRASYIRDVGRMQNGILQCTAEFGGTGLPQTAFQPTSSPWQHTKIYTNLPIYPPGPFPVFLIQRDGFYVVEDPSFEQYWQQIYSRYEVFVPMGPGRALVRPDGKRSSMSRAVINRDSQGMANNALYATRCSPHSQTCTMAYVPYSTVLAVARWPLKLADSLGAVIGLLLALTYLFLHQRNRSLDRQLRRAIRHDKLRLLYQPIVELATRRIVEAEALARWTDESGSAVSPDVFVHAAERAGFINELTELVVRHALLDFGETLRNNPNFRLNINVTASDLADPRFLPMLERSLARESVAAQSLTIEVTESSTARRQEAMDTIRALRRRGHCVQIDDFGTGYSSLAYLKDLHIDAIKIDRSFIQSIGTDAVIGNILPLILAMAESLELAVIAEGIETAEQADYFSAARRPVLGQGWYFGRPMPAADLQAQIHAGLELLAALA